MSHRRSGAAGRWLAGSALVGLATPLLLLVPGIRSSDLVPMAIALASTTLLTGAALGLLRCDPAPALRPPRWWATCVGALVLTGLLWQMRDGALEGLSGGVAVLIAAAPAAVLAVGPLTVVLMRRTAGRHGIVLPRNAALLALSRVDVVTLDLHRTVTTGTMQITAVDPLDPEHVNNLLFFAGALARSSDERFAQALARRAGRGRVRGYQVRAEGFIGSVDQHPVRVGDPSWVGLSKPPHHGLSVGVEVDQRALGTITLDEELRDGAADVVTHLAARGPITAVTDLDPARTALLADAIGVGSRLPEANAEERLGEVKEAQSRGARVLFAGPSTEVNQLALDQCDLAITDHEGRSPRRAHQVLLENFSIAEVERAARIVLGALDRVRSAKRIVAVFSVAAALGAATGLLGLYGALLASVGVTGVAAGVALRLARV